MAESYAQVSSTYGHGEAQTIVENCSNTLILRCSASENGGTARFASKLIGEREVIRQTVSRTRKGGFFAEPGHSVSRGEQHVTESAVLPAEVDPPARAAPFGSPSSPCSRGAALHWRPKRNAIRSAVRGLRRNRT
jgi:hypothetical protein